MPTPLPDDTTVLRRPPDAAEVTFLASGVVSAVRPDGGLTPLQQVLLEAMFDAMTGHSVRADTLRPVTPEAFAEGMARRNEAFRTRIVQVMILAELILVPLPPDVAARVEAFAHELQVRDDTIRIARRFAEGSLGLAAVDFARNGYVPDLEARTAALGTRAALDDAWGQAVDDPALAARWLSLADLDDGSLGRRVFEFYRARGFAFPGQPGSAPPLLAQHDWVHVLADYGTTVESELEVFGLIARANDDPRAFSLLAMVISLFETGYLASGAGLFEYSRGHLSRSGMAVRLADAMRRGALCQDRLGASTSVDFLAIDWFLRADRPVEAVRVELGFTPKSDKARVAGSVGPWAPGGISPFQLDAGRRAAEADGRRYESYGASPA